VAIYSGRENSAKVRPALLMAAASGGRPPSAGAVCARYSLGAAINFFPAVGYSPALMGYMLPSGTSSGAGGGGWSEVD